jgi:licheninase
MLNGIAGGYWYSFNDENDGGASVITPGNDPDEFLTNATENNGILVEFNLGAGFDYPYAAVAFDWVYTETGAAKQPGNLSAATGICIAYQGSGFALNMTQTNQVGFDSYTASVATVPSRTVVEIPFSRFAQEGWGDAFPQDLSAQEALQFQFKGTAGTTGSTTLFQVGFTGECS